MDGGADKLWALKSSLEIPLEHIAGIRAGPSAAHGWWHGWKLAGTELPGVIAAGTFYRNGQRVFSDVHDNAVSSVPRCDNSRMMDNPNGRDQPRAQVPKFFAVNTGWNPYPYHLVLMKRK
jgi:hypothetical protein